MSGAESRAALEDWAVELLDEAEELALGEHLEGCAPCTAHWGALSGAYVELTAMVHEDEAKDAIEETQAAALRTQVLDGVLAVVQEGPEATGDDEDKDEAPTAAAPAAEPDAAAEPDTTAEPAGRTFVLVVGVNT